MKMAVDFTSKGAALNKLAMRIKRYGGRLPSSQHGLQGAATPGPAGCSWVPGPRAACRAQPMRLLSLRALGQTTFLGQSQAFVACS